MDANGLRFWMLDERRDWALADDLADGATEIDFDNASRRLRLRSTFSDFTPIPPLTTHRRGPTDPLQVRRRPSPHGNKIVD